MAAMKWWGWGLEGVAFTHADKPELAPFIERALGLNVGRVTAPPPRLADLPVPASNLPSQLRSALVQASGEAFVSVDDPDRVVHARGKSFRDLVLQRRGEFARIPDVVIRP